jgi:surface polysaccharide O-acyltransferase-like enzyme
VLLHALFASTVYFKGTIPGGALKAVQMAENQLMWAVPCFLMITGALLLGRREPVTLKKLFGSYVRRVLAALVFFTLLFRILDVAAGEKSSVFPGFFSDLFYGRSWAHLWYLYLMIAIYMMLPFYQIVAERAGDTLMTYLIVVLLIFTSALPTLRAFGLPIEFYIPTELVYPVYVFLGYAIHKKGLPLVSSWLLFLSGTVLLVLDTLLIQSGADGQDAFSQLAGYSSLFVAAQACGIFGIFDHWKKAPRVAWVRSVDRCTFGIYLIHMIFIHWLMKWYGLDPFDFGPWIFVSMAVTFFVISYAITWVVKKIPKLDLL